MCDTKIYNLYHTVSIPIGVFWYNTYYPKRSKFLQWCVHILQISPVILRLLPVYGDMCYASRLQPRNFQGISLPNKAIRPWNYAASHVLYILYQYTSHSRMDIPDKQCILLFWQGPVLLQIILCYNADLLPTRLPGWRYFWPLSWSSDTIWTLCWSNEIDLWPLIG